MQTISLSRTPDDQRDYRLYRHRSGLTCLLISDPQASQATVVLQVEAGSSDEPEDRPGLAHLLEHMLFLGCESFPSPGSFIELIGHWDGRFNASTGPDQTGFFFSVAAAGLQPCLLHLAVMLARPLLDPARVETERRVLDAEYRTRLGDDRLHEQAALAAVINPAHPESRFTAGNAATLAGDPLELSRALRRFHAVLYQAANMALVVHAPAAPDSLVKVAEQAAAALARDAAPQETKISLPSRPPLFLPGRLPAMLQWQCKAQTPSWQLLMPLGAQSRADRLAIAWLCELLNDPAPHGGLGWLRGRQIVAELAAELEERRGPQWLLRIRLQPSGARPGMLLTELASWLAGAACLDPRQLPQGSRRRLAELHFLQGPTGDALAWCRPLAARLLRHPAAQVLQDPALAQPLSLEAWQRLLNELNRGEWLFALADPCVQAEALSVHTRTPYRVQALPPIVATRTARLEPPDISDPSIALSASADTEPRPCDCPGQIPAARHSVRIGWALPGRPGLASLQRLRLEWEVKTEAAGYWSRLGGLELSWRVNEGVIVLDAHGPESLLLAALPALVQRLSVPMTDALQDLAHMRWQHWRAEQAGRLPAYRLLDKLDSVLRGEPDGCDGARLLAEQAQVRYLHAGPRPIISAIEPYFASHASGSGVAQGQSAPSVTRLEGRALLEVNCSHSDTAQGLYLQSPTDDGSARAVWQLLHQFIAAPFFDDLRTAQQLGYWVVARYLSQAERPGLLLLVQSPEHGHERIERSIDDFLHRQYLHLQEIPFQRVRDRALQLAAALRAERASLEGRFEQGWRAVLGYAEPDRLREITVLEQLTRDQWLTALEVGFIHAPRLSLRSRFDS